MKANKVLKMFEQLGAHAAVSKTIYSDAVDDQDWDDFQQAFLSPIVTSIYESAKSESDNESKLSEESGYGKTYGPLFDRVKDKSVLQHKDVAKPQSSDVPKSAVPFETPLHRAAQYHKDALNHPDVARVKDVNGTTPLHNAAKYHKESIRHKSASKVKDNDGHTPLHHAAKYHSDVLHHPDVDKVKDKFGETPLHHAVKYQPKAALKHISIKSGSLEGNSSWWDKLPDDTKKAYKEAHPNTKYK